MVHPENPQITVLLDCSRLSPFEFPLQTFKSCVALLQDHYPNRLGCLLVVRVPSNAKVMTQTLYQVNMFVTLMFFSPISCGIENSTFCFVNDKGFEAWNNAKADICGGI